MRRLFLFFALACGVLAQSTVPPPSSIPPENTPFVVRGTVPPPGAGEACWQSGRLVACSGTGGLTAQLPIQISSGIVLCPECAQFQRTSGAPTSCTVAGRFYTDTSVTPRKLYQCNGSTYELVGGAAAWGDVTGTLASQSDLWTILQDRASTTGTYNNPAWITALSASKLLEGIIPQGRIMLGEQMVETAAGLAPDPLTTPRYRVTSGPPTGACELGRDYATDQTNGTFYHCPGAWSQIAGGGGSSSVTGLYSAPLDFAELCDGCTAELSYTATGLAAGQPVAAGPPDLPAGVLASPIAKADQVTWRLTNVSGAPVNLASATWAVRDLGTLGYLTASGTIDYAELCDGCGLTQTLTLNGAAAGDRVALGLPAAIEAGIQATAWVSAANTISIRLSNFSGAPVNPASATFSAAITR